MATLSHDPPFARWPQEHINWTRDGSSASSGNDRVGSFRGARLPNANDCYRRDRSFADAANSHTGRDCESSMGHEVPAHDQRIGQCQADLACCAAADYEPNLVETDSDWPGVTRAAEHLTTYLLFFSSASIFALSLPTFLIAALTAA